ncbi:ferredoxin family protein [Campylobacter curvus]|uniref:ferredoxin family protein n=1 Tax=Campylobacter curvus TaxID=200 RepID=UPI000375843A|nr:4Fe-4S dicluster domain-containing protein [Campylobacter curvus]QKF62119.1 ferredoxin-like protein FixX [Campylobacter curvus]UEB50406.1 4Fe-4S dicluster domain-containing protein [Campylobacter curvus]
MVNFGNVTERLNKNLYYLDEKNSHIKINQENLKKSGIGKLLVDICPAHVYTQESNGDVSASYAACLECGTCFALANKGELDWHYPIGGCGICFKEG